MTDTEFAEEYCNTHIPVAFTYLIKKKPTRDKIETIYSEELKQAVLAGLKEGRPKWHILAEEPNTLPKEGQKVKVLTEEGDIEESTFYYDTYYEEFAWSNIGLLKVYAWKEIVPPKEVN